MKRLVCATLALSLLGAVAIPASAESFGHGHGGYSRSYHHGGRDNSGALIGLGIGLFALGAIAASQHDNDRDRYQDRYYEGNYRPDYRQEYQSDYRPAYRQDYRGYNDGYGYR